MSTVSDNHKQCSVVFLMQDVCLPKLSNKSLGLSQNILIHTKVRINTDGLHLLLTKGNCLHLTLSRGIIVKVGEYKNSCHTFQLFLFVNKKEKYVFSFHFITMSCFALGYPIKPSIKCNNICSCNLTKCKYSILF